MKISFLVLFASFCVFSTGYAQSSKPKSPLTTLIEISENNISINKLRAPIGFPVKVTVTNSSDKALDFRDMLCSKSDAWETRHSFFYVFPREACLQNFPIFRHLSPGQSFTETIYVRLHDEVEKYHVDSLNLEMGYRTYIKQDENYVVFDEPPYEMIFWSNPVKFTLIK